MAAQWERLKTGLGIGPEPVAEPESLPSQLLHQLDEATTLSKTQVLSAALKSICTSMLEAVLILACFLAESIRVWHMPWPGSVVWFPGAQNTHERLMQLSDSHYQQFLL